MSQDIKGDLKNVKLDSYKGADIGVDIVKNGVKLAGDDAIMAVGAGLAPETLGLSVVAGIGASFIYNLSTDAVASVSKKAIHSKPIKHIANKLKDGVVDGANTIANETKKRRQ